MNDIGSSESKRYKEIACLIETMFISYTSHGILRQTRKTKQESFRSKDTFFTSFVICPVLLVVQPVDRFPLKLPLILELQPHLSNHLLLHFH